jgi:hypothetical protein
MKIQCEIIRDILPLYAEDMVSKPTREMVEEHLAQCGSCNNELNAMKKEPSVIKDETTALQRVSRGIRRRRWLAVMTVFFFLITLISGTVMMLDASIYLSAEEAVEDIWLENDVVKIRWDNRVIANGSNTETEAPGNYAVTAWTNLTNILFPSERLPYDLLDEEVKLKITRKEYESLDNISTYSLPEGQDGCNFWYYDFSEGTTELILDAGKPWPEDVLMADGNLCKNYVYVLSIVCMVCTAVGLLQEKKWYGQLIIRGAILSGCALLSAVIVTAGQLVDIYGAFTEMIVDSTVVVLPMALCALCGYELLKLRQQDKGL